MLGSDVLADPEFFIEDIQSFKLKVVQLSDELNQLNDK